MKTLMMILAMVTLVGCGDRVLEPVPINYVGTWNGSGVDRSLGAVKETWTFTATDVTVERRDLGSNLIDVNTYTWETVGIGHLLLNGAIDVMVDEIAETCFVLKTMPGRDYVYHPNMLRPQ